VFSYAEKYRFQRHEELLKLVSENTYSEFIEKFGNETLKEFHSVELWYRYMLIHSTFISAYSAFESQLISIAEMLEKNVPSKIKIKDISKTGSDIDRLRKYLELVHNIQNADSSKRTWIQIEKFRGIRNILVHHGGRLIQKIDKRQDKIDFLVSYQVVIDDETFTFYIREIKFLKDFFALIKTYCWDIIKEIAPVPPLPII
jgi:wyosine [tRNA(Phe)-imidazoG37] synthetase (radical SAM superfamily)